jgi:glycosyltransferase involved in cell wall biosynthesis
MKKVLIDGYYLDKPRGMGRYIQELLYSLIKSEGYKQFEITLLLPDSSRYNPKNFRVIYKKKRTFPLWEQFTIPKIAKRYGVDIVVSPYNTFPVLLNSDIKNVVTVHDVMFLTGEASGGNLYQKFGNLYRKYVVKRLTNSHKVISVSNQTKKALQEHLNIESTVIYTAIDNFYENSIKTNAISETISTVIKENYLFHVGGINPHKNTERVIKAFLSLDKSDLKLVVAGLPTENRIKEKYSKNENIMFLEWITDREIAKLYENARSVIFPSLMEGYGLPIVEAFKFNTPVITSNLAPMNEIAKGAALLVDPFSVEDIKRAIKDVSIKDFERVYLEKIKEAMKTYNSTRMGLEVLDLLKENKGN